MFYSIAALLCSRTRHAWTCGFALMLVQLESDWRQFFRNVTHSTDRRLIVLAIRRILDSWRRKKSSLDTMVFDLRNDKGILFLDRYQKNTGACVLGIRSEHVAGWRVVWGNMCENWNVAGCGQKITKIACIVGIVGTDSLHKTFGGSLWSDRGSSHETIQGRSGILRTSRLDEDEFVLLGLSAWNCSLPDGMPCFAAWDTGFINAYSHGRRPSGSNSPTAAGRSDEASRYPADVTAQPRQCQMHMM